MRSCPSACAMRSPIPSLPVAGTDSPPVASTTRSHSMIPPDVSTTNPRAARDTLVTVVPNCRSTPLAPANVTSASRTSRARLDRGNSLPDSSSSTSGMPRSSSKKARCSCSGHDRSMARSRCGGESVTKRSGVATDGNTLHRPPPLMRILRPPSLVRSISVTLRAGGRRRTRPRRGPRHPRPPQPPSASTSGPLSPPKREPASLSRSFTNRVIACPEPSKSKQVPFMLGRCCRARAL